jgi:hypothetical protein
MKKTSLLLSLCVIFYFTENLHAQSTFQEKDSVFQRCQKIIFNDEMSNAEVGKPDANWKILQGNQIVDNISETKVVSFKEAGFTVLKPNLLTNNYLGYEFTIEFDVRRGNSLNWFADSLFVIYLNSINNSGQSMFPFSFNYASYIYPDTRIAFPDPKMAMDNPDYQTLHMFYSKTNKNSLLGTYCSFI